MGPSGNQRDLRNGANLFTHLSLSYFCEGLLFSSRPRAGLNHNVQAPPLKSPGAIKVIRDNSIAVFPEQE